MLEQTVLLLGVMLLWSLAATAGRAATSPPGCDVQHRGRAAIHGVGFAPIFALQLLRAMWTMIALAVAVGLFALRRGDGAERASAARGA